MSIVSRTRTLVFLTLAAVALLGVPVSTADAGSDDFEFGQRLAAKGRATGDKAWFDYARRVYQGILDNANASQLNKQEARYGLADIARSEALAAAARRDVTYKNALKAFQAAIDGIEEFVQANPKHPKAKEAKLSIGQTRLAFVEWARGLLEDKAAMKERGTSTDTVMRDGQKMIQAAIRYFDELDDGWDKDTDPDEFAQIAHYWWVVCKYYAAQVHRPCSTANKEALGEAYDALDEFILLFDGTTVAIYACDFLGLTLQAQADCENNEEEKAGKYRAALGWFRAVIATEWTDRESLKLIARGYYHLGKCCLQARRVGDDNFLRVGVGDMRRMLESSPKIGTVQDGIRAKIQWAKLEAQTDNVQQAIAILSEAGKEAEEGNWPWLVRELNEVIKITLDGNGGGGGPTNMAPDVLKRVADNLYQSKEYDKAIVQYQQVISACTDTTDDLMNFEIPSWQRIAQAHKEQGQLLAAALAYQPIHAAWVDGRIPRNPEAGSEDPNLLMAGSMRMRSVKLLEDLYKSTESPLFEKMFKEMREELFEVYKDHPITDAGKFPLAVSAFNDAMDQKRKKNNEWKSTMDKARSMFREVSVDTTSLKQHDAWVYLARIEKIRDKWKDVVKVAEEAQALWESAEMKAQVAKFPAVGQRILDAHGRLKVWHANALLELKKPKAALPLMKDWAVKHGNLDKGGYGMLALGYLVRAQVADDDINGALQNLRRLSAKYPKSPDLPKITFELAQFYKDEYGAIAKEYREIVVALQGDGENVGLQAERRTAEAEVERYRARIVTLTGTRRTMERLVEQWEDAVAEAKEKGIEVEVKGLTENDYNEAKKTLHGNPSAEKENEKKGVLKLLEELGTAMRAVEATRDDLATKINTKLARKEAIKPSMYPPLRKAADLYWDWDQVLIKEKVSRDPGNLKTFADLYFLAASLVPSETEAWDRARSLYEVVRDKGTLDADDKSRVASRLGRIYARLSTETEDPKARQDHVKNAVELLQGALADLPDNNPLLVQHLAGDLAVIAHTDAARGVSILIPIRKATDVADFRKAVNELGSAQGPLPTFAESRANTNYNAVLSSFKTMVQGLSDERLGPTVASFAKAGVDGRFLRKHGDVRRDFRLALARAYALRADRAQKDAEKALSLVSTLVNGALAAPEDSEDWWEAQVIRLEAYAYEAQAALANNAAADAVVKDRLEEASTLMKGLHRTNPGLGDGIRDGTRVDLKALLTALNTSRAKAGMTPLNLDLDSKPDTDGTTGGDE